MALCELCGKMFVDVRYLKFHCFRRHNLNSCIYSGSPKDKDNTNLKFKIVQLETQLKEMKSNSQNNLQVKFNFKIL